MRETVIWCCVSILSTILVIGSCTNSYGEFDLSESPIGFLKGLNQVNVTFPTDVPGKVVKFKFKKKQGAIRPTLKQALAFVRSNSGYRNTYVRDVYDCKQFAYNLFLDAQKQNFQAHFVILDLKNEKEGHALTAIETVDAGTLYVDFTPFLTTDGLQKPSQSIAYVKAGEPYIRVPLNILSGTFKNSDADFLYFKKQIEKGDREIAMYNASIIELEREKQVVQAKVDNFKQRTKDRLPSSEYRRLKEEHQALETEVQEIEGKYNLLSYEENRIRTLYMDADLIGRGWVVEKFKIVP